MDLSAYPGTVIDHPLYQDNLVIDQRNYTTTIYCIQKKKKKRNNHNIPNSYTSVCYLTYASIKKKKKRKEIMINLKLHAIALRSLVVQFT